MTITELVDHVQSHGAMIEVVGGKLAVDMPDNFPESLLDLLRQHKKEVMDHFRGRSAGTRYNQIFSGGGPGNSELAEIQTRVLREGHVLCWSEVVKDYIAFCADDTVLSKIPSDFVPYFLHELSLLFPDNGTQLSVNTLKRVHAAKTTGAEVKDKYDEESTESRAQRRE